MIRLGKVARDLAATVVLAAALGGVVAPAAAFDGVGLCAPLQRMTALAASGTVPDPHTAQAALQGAEGCSSAISLTGGQSLHCRWAFPYRDPAAQGFFDRLADDLPVCLESVGDILHEKGVNHPDTYDLRAYSLRDAKLTLALKDKAQLQKTYVFLGLAGAAPKP